MGRETAAARPAIMASPGPPARPALEAFSAWEGRGVEEEGGREGGDNKLVH